jgi:long-subunit fatty acid transport protein
MRTKIVFFVTLFAMLVFTNSANAQFIEDALRFSLPGNGSGARALGMGNAYISISDDYSSVWWNPAGLAQIKKFEFTGSLSNFGYKNDATFFGNTSNYSNSSTSLNNLGFVFPFPTVRGSLVFAIGYSRTNDLTTGISFNGFNPSSSIIPTMLSSNQDKNIPFQTWLTDNDGTYTPIQRNVYQSGEITEGGSLGNWAFSGALDVAPNLSVGLSFYILTGSYTYDRTFNEEDTKNIYNYLDTINYSNIDFKKLTLEDNVTGNYSGIGASFGVHYRLKDFARFGLTIKTPFRYYIKEDFSTKGVSLFDNNDTYNYKTLGSGEYDVITPFILSGGGSFNYKGLILAGDFEWIDYTQLEFANANSDILSLNKDIKNTFQSVINLHAGAEYTIPEINLKLRAGFALYPSPYKGDPSDFNRTQISFGLGYLVDESLMVDAAYSMGSFNTLHSNYDNYSKTDEKIKTNNVILSLSFRF